MAKRTAPNRTKGKVKSKVGRSSSVGRGSSVGKGSTIAKTIEIEDKGEARIGLSVPLWMDQLLEEQAAVRGDSKSAVIRSWMFEIAASRYPDRVPTIGG